MGWISRIFSPPDPKVEQFRASLSQTLSSGGEKAATAAPAVVWSFQNGVWAGGAYGQMYRQQPAVRAVVDFLARNIAQLNPKVYERLSGTDRVEVGDHPLAVLLRNPNPNATRFRHLRDTVADLAIYDRAVWVKARQGGTVRGVLRRPPQVWTVEPDGRWRDNGSGRVYGRDDLVLFRGYSPDGDDNGVSPLETLRRVLAEEFAAAQHRENMWRNSARQSGWLERPIEAPQWSDDARRRFRADIEAVMSGGHNAGRIGILEEGMKWNPSSFSPKDTEYIEGRRLTYEEVCVEYGLTPSLLGMGGDTASSAESRHRQAYQDVLGPWLRMLQDEIELQLLPEFEPLNTRRTVYVEFNLAEKLKGSFEEQSKSLTTSVGVPYMTVNEGRARLNLPRIDEDWADAPVQPLNVMYGGQPAVTVPTDDPGRASFDLGRKAVDPSEEQRNDVAREHAEMLRSYFARVERATTAKSSKSREKWDDELRGDLFTLADRSVRSVGFLTAGQLRGRYDHGRVTNWLLENADRTAKSVNDHTFTAIEAAADEEELRHVFEVAKTSKADQLGFSLGTVLVNFARTEAALHSAQSDGKPRMKTWIVTSSKSRHPQMHGETVPVSETFSNGARWPGDPVLGADEAAGCNCQLELGEAT